jgi:hypothetical protein
MASSLRDWIEEQSTRLKKPDINLLIDLFISSPSDQETSELAYGILGDSPQIKTFVQELCVRRQRVGISPSTSSPTPPVQNKAKDNANAQFVGNTGLVGKTTMKIDKNAQNNTQPATLTPPIIQPNLSSYAQPTVLSHSQPQQPTPPVTKSKSKINPNISFASQVSQTANNNPNANQTSSDPAAMKQHSASLNSGVFFTEDDVGILDIAQLRHKEVQDQSKANKDANAEEFGILEPKSSFPNLGSKSKKDKDGKKDDKSNDKNDKSEKIAEQLGTHFTGRFQVQEKKRKPVKKDTTIDESSDPLPPNPQGDNNNNNNNNNNDDNDDSYHNITFFTSRGATRPICECMARRHRFYGNCHDCGRIICLFEGEGDCFHCGSYVINFDANREIVNLYNRAHQNDDKKKQKNDKKNVTQVTHHTRKALHANPNNSVQNDLELIETLVDSNDKYIQELNTKGDGIICIPNEIFFEKMQKYAQTARGYYYRTGKKPDLFLQTLSQKSQNSDAPHVVVSSIDIKADSAYGSNTANTNLSHEERVAVGLKKALAFRDTLLQREKEKEKRTKVIDEQNDYYDFENNIWLDKEEKAIKTQIRDEVHDLIEKTNELRTLTIDIDEKTGKIKQNFTKTDLSLQGIGSVGAGAQGIVDKATKTVEKRLAKEDREHGEVENDDSVTVLSTGKTYSRREMAQRKEVLMRRIDVEKARREHDAKLAEEKAAKEAEEKATSNTQNSRKKKSTPSTAQESSLPLDSRHLSGRALLVFNTLKETLKPEQKPGQENPKDDEFLNSSWASRLGALHQQFDEEYEFYTQNPDQYIAQEFMPLYNDGEMNSGMVENATDSGCG